jgi:hypothetical protein
LDISYPEALLRLHFRGPSSLQSKKIEFKSLGIEVLAVSSVLKMRKDKVEGETEWIQPVMIEVELQDDLRKSVVLCYNGELYGLDQEIWESKKV